MSTTTLTTTATDKNKNNNNNNNTLNVVDGVDGVGVVVSASATSTSTSSTTTLKSTPKSTPTPLITTTTTTTRTTTTFLTDEPKYSSAALCLNLIHLSKKFQPEYTHQCCSLGEDDGLKEYFYGYQPNQNKTNNAITKILQLQLQQQQRQQQQKETNEATTPATTAPGDFILHKSHYQQNDLIFIDGNNNSLHDLSIQIQLSPSCRKCTVNIEITTTNNNVKNTTTTNETDDDEGKEFINDEKQQQQQPEEDDGHVSKKLKIDTTTTDTTSTKENNNESNNHNHNHNINNDDDMIRAQQQQPKQEAASSSSSTTTRNRSRMTKNEIQQCISKALPEIVSNNNNPDNVNDDFLKQPIGNIIEEFTIESRNKKRGRKNNDDDDNDHHHHQHQRHRQRQYCLTLADGQDPIVNQYHNQIQKLALWFIENADDVNVSDVDNGGYWKILYLFEKFDEYYVDSSSENDNDDDDDDDDNDDNRRRRPGAAGKGGGESSETKTKTTKTKYALVGYMTLFHFRSPFHKPNPGIIIRICQALILPHYQGFGLGSKMMRCIYDNIVHDHNGHGRRRKQTTTTSNSSRLLLHNQNLMNFSNPSSSIVLINVEDPAPAFVNLRNKIDLQFMMEYGQQWWPSSSSSSSNRNIVDDENYFTTISQQDAIRVSGLAKITPRQVIIVNEMMKYIALQNYLVSVDDDGNDNNNDNINNKERLTTKFRLMVKKRLNKEHGIEISQYATKERKKAYLAELYEQGIQYYQKLLKKMLPPTPPPPPPPPSTSST